MSSASGRPQGAGAKGGELVSELPLVSLLADPVLQPRLDGLDPEHVRTLEEAPESWPPLVAVERDGGYILIDGFHRLAAAQNLGLTSVLVKLATAPADGDLRGLAFQLNSEHGKPLTLSDRRAEAERLLREDPTVSNLEVAERTGLSPTTVASIRARLEQAQAIPETAQRVSRAGVSYTPVSPARRPGELPAEGLREVLGRVFAPAERRAQRVLVGYFTRLAVALEEGDELEGWESTQGAAEACRLVLGAEQAAELAERLGRTSGNVLAVAVALGYRRGAGA